MISAANICRVAVELFLSELGALALFSGAPWLWNEAHVGRCQDPDRAWDGPRKDGPVQCSTSGRVYRFYTM